MGIVTIVPIAIESFKGNSSRILIKKWGGQTKVFYFLFFSCDTCAVVSHLSVNVQRKGYHH